MYSKKLKRTDTAVSLLRVLLKVMADAALEERQFGSKLLRLRVHQVLVPC